GHGSATSLFDRQPRLGPVQCLYLALFVHKKRDGLLRFVFRDSHPNERANNTADCAAGSEGSKSGYDRTGRNQRTNSGNCKNTDPGQQSQSSTITPPVVTPAAVPSGAFVLLSCAGTPL